MRKGKGMGKGEFEIMKEKEGMIEMDLVKAISEMRDNICGM